MAAPLVTIILFGIGACGGRLDSASPGEASPGGGGSAANTSLPLDDPGRAPYGCSGTVPTKMSPQLLQYAGGNSGNDTALDADYLYLTSNVDNSVKRMARGGGTLETVATGQVGTLEIHVHGTRVCWRNFGDEVAPNTTIWCSPTTTFAPQQVVEPGDHMGRVYSFDFDDHDVYYVLPPSIYRVPLDGSSPPALLTTDDLPQQPFSPMSLSTQSGFLYWASITSDGNGSIRRCPSGSGCTPEILDAYPGQSGQNTQVVTSATHVYWTSSVGFHGDVYRMPLAGGNATHLASCEDMYPEKLSADANDVYWAATTMEYAENVWRLPLDGSSATPVASSDGQESPNWPSIFSLNATGDGAIYTSFDWSRNVTVSQIGNL